MKIIRIPVIVLASSLGSLLILSAPASAQALPRSPMSARPAVAAPAAASSCNFNGSDWLISPTEPTAYGPADTPTTMAVTGSATLTWANGWQCNAHALRVRLQRKVCGFWGCHYHDQATSSWIDVGSDETTASVDGACVSGTHRYRIAADFTYDVLSFDPILGGVLTEETSESDGPGVEITC